MGPGDLVYIDIIGERHMGIIQSMDPTLPEDADREYNSNDYCWVIITHGKEYMKKWIKMEKLVLV